MEITQAIRTVSSRGTYSASDTVAWSRHACPYCGKPSMLMVARFDPNSFDDNFPPQVAWLVCLGCGSPATVNNHVLAPGPKEFPTPEGTPDLETKIWEEVRNCLSVAAYNAVAMLCRKLLLHLVFTHERSLDGNATARNINFSDAVRYLLDNGVINAAHEPLASEIRTVGNRANHELPDIDEDEARKIVRFTHFLFLSVYEMPTKAETSTPFIGDAAEPFDGDLEPEAPGTATNGG